MIKLTEGTIIRNTNTGNTFTVESVSGRGDAMVIFKDGSKSIYKAERLEHFFSKGTLAIEETKEETLSTENIKNAAGVTKMTILADSKGEGFTFKTRKEAVKYMESVAVPEGFKLSISRSAYHKSLFFIRVKSI